MGTWQHCANELLLLREHSVLGLNAALRKVM